MKKAELILITIVIVSLLLGIINVKGNILFTSLSILSLSSFYFYLSVFLFNGIPLKSMFKKSSYTGISVMRILGSIFLGTSISITLVGILFKFNYWPGAHITYLSGINFLILSILVMVIKLIMGKDSFYKKHLFKSLVFLVVALSYYFLPFGILESIKYRNNPEILVLIEELKADINNEEMWQRFHYLNNKDIIKQ